MPEKKTIQRARAKAKKGRAPSTQAGEFVKEEIDHIRKGKHGARSAKQAIAIGLSKARKAGVKLPAYKGKKKKAKTKRTHQATASPKRSRASTKALQREPRSSVSPAALSAQAHGVAQRRGPEARHDSAMKAVKTKGSHLLQEEAKKAARTRMGEMTAFKRHLHTSQR